MDNTLCVQHGKTNTAMRIRSQQILTNKRMWSLKDTRDWSNEKKKLSCLMSKVGAKHLIHTKYVS